MKGVDWCIKLVCAGVPLALLGLALHWDFLILVGGGAILAVWFGWPVLLLMGVLDEAAPSVKLPLAFPRLLALHCAPSRKARCLKNTKQ